MNLIVADHNVAGATLNVDRDTLVRTAIENPIPLYDISIGPKILAAGIISKQDSDFSTVRDFV